MNDRSPPNDEDETTKPKPPSESQVSSTTAAREDAPVIIRRPRRLSGVEVNAQQVVADAEPVLLEYLLRRAELDESNEAAWNNEEDAEARHGLYNVFEGIIRERSQSSQQNSASSSAPDMDAEDDEDDLERHQLESLQSSGRSVNDTQLIRTIGSELAALGDRLDFQVRFNEPFDKTYELLEQRAALSNASDANASLITVFRDAVRRLLRNQPFTWATLVTLFEFAYYVMRRLVTQLLEKAKEVIRMVSRVREIVTAFVRYVCSADAGIVDWLVGEGGWRAALELESIRPPGPAAVENRALNSAWYITLGAILVLHAVVVLTSPGAPK